MLCKSYLLKKTTTIEIVPRKIYMHIFLEAKYMKEVVGVLQNQKYI